MPDKLIRLPIPLESNHDTFTAIATAPEGTPKTFPVAAGFNPIHKLSKRSRAGHLPYPELFEQFHELRTPLNWAVGFALFGSTSERNPRDWQEVKLADLVEKVYALTERGAQRRGDHRKDILAEVVKLHSAKIAYVRYGWQKLGRYWARQVTLGREYAIPSLELVFIDRGGRRVATSEVALVNLTVPLEVGGRRTFKPDGSTILALPKGDFRLDTIRWRWNPSFADDMEAAVALDTKGKAKLSAGGYGQPTKGKALRAGYNIRVANTIFKALAVLRTEGATIAHDLLVQLAMDIAPRNSAEPAGRNVIEKEAGRLYDLLGLTKDPKNPCRRQDAVAAAINRLKQPDIGALLPGSDAYPVSSRSSDRRVAPFYRLIRSQEFTPRATLVTNAEAKLLRSKASGPISATPDGPMADQITLPGMDTPPRPPIPSGSDIRTARENAGVNLRDFAEKYGHGRRFHNTWARYERGESVRTGKIPPEAWNRIREFVAKHLPNESACQGSCISFEDQTVARTWGNCRMDVGNLNKLIQGKGL